MGVCQGHKLARQMELNLTERSRSLRKLEQAEIELEKRNQKLTETIEQLPKTQQELIYSEKDELIQVWTNLIHNAIQAMSGKGFLRVTTDRENDYLKIQIADSGGGIPHSLIRNFSIKI